MINILEKITKYKVFINDKNYYVTLIEKEKEEIIEIKDENNQLVIDDITWDIVETYFDLIINK